MAGLEAPPRSPLDDVDRLLITHLRRCSFRAATFDKRFARSMGHIAEQAGGQLTVRQRSCLSALVFRYRRQIDNAVVAKAALRLAAEQAAFRLESADLRNSENSPPALKAGRG